MNICLECNEKLSGRLGQKFCSPYCKSAYHYKNNKEKASSMFKSINESLKLNRRILKKFTASGQSQIYKQMLLDEGFDFNHFTHYWKAENGNLYLFCYEFGYRDLKVAGKSKYTLVTWQDYMNKK